MTHASPLHVAAAVIRNPDGRVLLARRGVHQEHGGLWEFPGGKLQPEEPALQALARELHEELGISIRQEATLPLIEVTYPYPARVVQLQVFEVFAWSGEPHGREGQLIEWADASTLRSRQFPAANLPVVSAALLPRILLVTPEPDDEEAFFSGLRQSLLSGVKLVQFRAKSRSGDDFARLASAAIACCRAHDARILLNGDPGLALEVGADGVHLSSAAVRNHAYRPVPADRLLSVACHSPQELAEARRVGADLVLLGPVLATETHPETPPLGWRLASAWRPLAGCPVYALGGQSVATLPEAVACGLQGSAGIRGFWAMGSPLPDPRLRVLVT
ncbi:MAG: Nudix family hydrolase [Gammaproteobacteria bacterium]